MRLRKELRERFLETAHREGRSAAEIVREFMEEYVRRHGLGNPQARLDVILDRGAPPYEPPTCSFCLKPATYICYLRNSLDGPSRKLYGCEFHRNLLRAQNPYYGERKL